MKRIFQILTSILLFTLTLSSKENSPLFDVGLWGGLNYNIHNGGFSDFPEYPGCCGNYENGDGFGFGFGALFDYNIDDKFFLTARIGWRPLSGELTSDEVIGNTELRDQNGNTVGITDAKAEYSIIGNISGVNFEPGLIYKITSNIGVTAGLNLGYLFSTNFDRSETILSPQNIVYQATGTRIRNEVIDGEIPDANSIQLGLFAGVFYDIPIQESVVISPEFRFYQPLNEIRDNWSINSFYLGVALKKKFYPPLPVEDKKMFLRDTSISYEFGLDNTIVELIDTQTNIDETRQNDKIIRLITISEQYEKRVPREVDLKIDVKLTGIDENGEKVDNPKLIIEEFKVQESFPVLPYIYFNQGSANLTDSGLNLLDDSEIDKFKEANLEWNTLSIYSELLNIIASRLKDNPDNTIRIIGANNDTGIEINNLQLSERRAESVRDYFVNVWDISPKRLVVESRNLPEKPANNDKEEGVEENRRVEIFSSDWKIMQPVYLTSIEKYANPPQVEITPVIRTDAGIKNWSIDVYEEGTGLREYEGVGIPEPIIWEVGKDPIPRNERKVNVKMNITDKFDQQKQVNKDLEIEQLTIKKKRFEMIEDKEIQRFSLIVFDYDKSELTENHKLILDDIKESINPDSKVKVYGYADRTGEKLYNKQLSQKRANEVANYLGLKVPSNNVVGIGNDELLYDNDLPQGRAYSRTVRIVIETPVK